MCIRDSPSSAATTCVISHAFLTTGLVQFPTGVLSAAPSVIMKTNGKMKALRLSSGYFKLVRTKISVTANAQSDKDSKMVLAGNSPAAMP